MKRKGQAAMEFLMTYGWAILAAIIVIGVLAIYFRPGSLTTSNAIVTAPFYANAWNVDATANGINLELQNNAGEVITIQSITVTGIGSSSGDDCTLGVQPDMSISELRGFFVNGDVAVDSCAFDAGETYTGDITIRYTRGGGDVQLTSTGTIADKAVA